MSKHINDTASHLTLGVDIGTTPISAAFIRNNQLIADTYRRIPVDLDGIPRPINIEHAFHNIDSNRKGKTYALYYAESFVTPAAAGEHQLINEDHQSIQNIKAFVN